MPIPVILSACRTPIGRFQGSLSSVAATELGAIAVRAAVERAGLTPDQVAEVIMGQVLTAGAGQAPARQAALNAGLPPTVAAVTVNMVCGSGLKAVMLAAQAIRCRDADVIVAGGMESMSRAPHLLARDGAKIGDRMMIDSMLRDGLASAFSGRGMGEIAESLARADGISRQQQDHYSYSSHCRAVAAAQWGAFESEIVPVAVGSGSGESRVSVDEGPRPDTSEEQLARLRPSFARDGTITAGNSSMISDGAAALVVASESFATRLGLRPLARVIAVATAGVEPDELFVAPVPAIREVLDRAGMTAAQIDLFEINEAFAAQMIACMNRLDLSAERVNVNGGAIALGHPIGASGARVVATLIHALRSRNQRFGLAALCLGGGNAVAAIFEAVA